MFVLHWLTDEYTVSRPLRSTKKPPLNGVTAGPGEPLFSARTRNASVGLTQSLPTGGSITASTQVKTEVDRNGHDDYGAGKETPERGKGRQRGKQGHKLVNQGEPPSARNRIRNRLAKALIDELPGSLHFPLCFHQATPETAEASMATISSWIRPLLATIRSLDMS